MRDGSFYWRFLLLVLLWLPLAPSLAFAEDKSEATAGGFAACVERLALSSSDMTTLGEIRAHCRLGGAEEEISALPPPAARPAGGAAGKKLLIDQENVGKPFTIMTHRANYFLFAAHNFRGWSGAEFAASNRPELAEPKRTEIQFQISGKMPLAVDLFGLPLDIYGAYTMRSFWQAYAQDDSSPFREIDHEPEVWLQLRPDWHFGGWVDSLTTIGFDHQSNGQSGILSRSWNRIIASTALGKGGFLLIPRLWYRLPEDPDNDDNPHIVDYLGHGDLTLGWRHSGNTFTAMLRNNLESGFSRGAVQLGWSFPLAPFPYLRGYIQYFSGYGESLIDYNRYVNRIGIGISLSDLL
jgi:phospholipase A1